MVNGTKAYLRPLSSAVISQSQTLAAQSSTPVALLPQVRSFQTTPVTRDIDSAAKFIGAGAATVGVAGSGKLWYNIEKTCVWVEWIWQTLKNWHVSANQLRACKNLALGAPIRVLSYSIITPREGLRHGEHPLGFVRELLLHPSRMLT